MTTTTLTVIPMMTALVLLPPLLLSSDEDFSGVGVGGFGEAGEAGVGVGDAGGMFWGEETMGWSGKIV